MSDNFSVRWEVAFTRIPNWLLTYRDSEGSSLSPQAIKVYLALASFADNDTFEAFPSQTILAERADMSTRSVQRYLKELEDLEVIQVFKKSNGKDKWVSNYYKLMVNPPKTMTDSTQPAIEAEVVDDENNTEVANPYEELNLGMTEGDRPRKRTLNDEIWDGFVDFRGSAPVDDKVIGDWLKNIPRLVKIFKSKEVDPYQFKLLTMTACAAYITKFGDLPLNPRTLADNWENIQPQRYNKALIEKATAQIKYGNQPLPDGVTVADDGRIKLDD